jgi:hypothetical protein
VDEPACGDREAEPLSPLLPRSIGQGWQVYSVKSVRNAALGVARVSGEVLSNFVDGEFQAAWDCFTPSTKVTPTITSLKSVDPFNARQRFDALSISLNTIVRHAVRLPLPFVLT